MRLATSAPPTLQSVGIGLVTEMTQSGPDFYRFCDEHSWASHPASKPEDTGRCPFCAVAMNKQHGLTRWLRLKARMS
jgi:hypothetical protein